jgi:hypothetical protein
MTACHSGFYCLTSNTICGRFIADGNICLSCCSVLHRSASHNFSLSTEFTCNSPIYYRAVVYRSYLAQTVSRRTYNLLHSNLFFFLHTNSSTYEFTYVQIGSTKLSTLSYDLMHTNLDNILPTNSLYNVTPMNSSVIMKYQHLTSDICRLVNENNQWSSTIVIPQGDGILAFPLL